MKALNAAIYNKLSSATAVTTYLPGTSSIYALQAPEGSTMPYIVYNIQGGGDRNDTSHRVKDLVVWVRAYSGSSNAQAGSIDAAIDAQLHMGTISVSGWSNIWLAREGDIEMVQNDPTGKQVWTNGGLYRVLIEDT